MQKGGTSWTILAQPPMKLSFPMMHGAEAADDGVILDDDVATDGAVIGKDDVIPDDAVVADVAVGEEVIVAADDRPIPRRGGAVDGAELAEGVVGTDL